MQIVVNGQPRQFADGINIAQLIEQLDLPANRVAVECNRQLVPRSRHAQTPLADGDTLEVVTLVGGG